MAQFRVFPAPTVQNLNPAPFVVGSRRAARAACARSLGVLVKDARSARYIRSENQESFRSRGGLVAAFRNIAAR